MVKLHYFLKVFLMADRICQGILGMGNLHRDPPLQACLAVPSQVLTGNVQHSPAGVCTSTVSSANKSAEHRDAIKLTCRAKGRRATKGP